MERRRADYREARTTVILGKGESRNVLIDCPFEPERIIVDPDAKVLQLRRMQAKLTMHRGQSSPEDSFRRTACCHGTGNRRHGSGPNSYRGGLRSSLELRIVSGVIV